MKSSHTLTRSIATLLALTPFATHGAADTLTGTGGATQPGVSWAPTTAAGGTIGVWSLGAIPGTGDNAIISATGLVDIRGSAAVFGATHSTEIQDLTFNSAADVTLNNNSSSQDMLLILNGGRGAGIPLISTVGNFAYTIQGPGSNATTAHPLRMQLKASGDISVALNTLTISSAIGEVGAQSLNKNGAGTLILSGASTFTAGLTHSVGILRATSNAGALGAGNLTLTGAELQLANDTALAFNRPTIVTANTQITSDRLVSGAGVVHTLGTLSIGAQALSIAPGANSTGATGGIAFGATTLSGAATFSVATNALLTLGATDIGANLITLTGAGPATINGLTSSGTASVAVTGTGITTIAGVVSAGGTGLVKSGTGRAVVSGASTFATGVTVNAGVLEGTNNGAFGTGAAVANTGGTLELNLANSTYTASSITANAGGRVAVRNVTTNSAVTLAGGTLGTRTGDVGTYAGPVNVTADSSAGLISYSTPANNQSITISGKLSGASALTVTGGATANAGLKALILTNPTNDFSGVFNVNAGQRLTSLPVTTGNTLGTASVNLTGGFLRLNDNGTGIDGTLAYGTNLTIGTGGGTLDLDRASGVNTGNTFALGNLTIGAVNLAVNNGANGYKATFAGGTLTGNATITNTGGVAIAGAVTGGFGLTKAGTGTLTLGGANGYTGATTVSAGTLNLTGSVAADLALGGAGTLAGNGTVTGTTTVASGGTISPGIAGSGTLTMGGLTFGTAAADTVTVNFTTDGPGNINVTNAGGLTANGNAGTVSLKLLTTLPTLGQHTIIDYSGAIGGTNGFSAFTLGPLPNPRIIATLQNDGPNTRIFLNVTAVDAPRWSGALSSEWSTALLGAPKNWNLVVNVGTTDFIAGDNVLFDDAAGNPAVLLNVEDVAPASVVFDNSTAKNYTLGGSFKITGTTGLVKTKNGTVTISNTNSFTGPVSIATGTISVNAVADSAANSPLGAGNAVSLTSGGTLEFTGATGSTNRPTSVGAGGGTVKVAAASTLTLAGAVTAAGAFTLDNAGTATVSGAIGGAGGAIVTGAGTTTLSGNVATNLAINAAGNTLVSGNITAAGTLTKAGAGTATLIGATNNPSSTTISAGILQIGDGTAAGSIGTAAITNNATLAFNTPAAGIVLGNVISGSGALTKTGAGNLTLNGAGANTFAGTTTVSGGSLILSKTTGVNAIGGNLVVETGGTVSYGTTAGQLADHIPDTASITINGGTFGSGAAAPLITPTTGVVDTVGSVTVNSGSFLSGRGPGATPSPFTVNTDFKLLGGTGLVQRGGGLSAKFVQIASPGVLDLDGGSGTANNQSRLNVGTDGLSLTGATINLNAGPSAVIAASVGSIVTLNGNVTSTGTSLVGRSNPTVSAAFVDLAAGVRTFNVTGTLTVAPDVGIAATDLAAAGLVKTGPGKLALTGAQNYASLVNSAGRTDVSKTIGTGTSTVTANAGTINFAESQTLASLTIADGAEVTLGNPLPPAPPEALAMETAVVAASAAVPEPGSLTLLIGGLTLLLGARRRNAEGVAPLKD